MSPKRILQIIIIIFSLILITAIAYFMMARKSSNEIIKKDSSLEIWHPYLSEKVFADIISKYEQDHPGVEITYHKYEGDNYELDSLKMLSANEGPDVWAIKNDWMEQHYDKFVPAQDGLFSESKKAEANEKDLEEYGKTFAPVVVKDNIVDDKIYAVPLAVDTLALYYNQDKISNPPKTWEELSSAIALGGSENVDYSSDILSLLMLQNHTPMISEDNKSALFNTEIAKSSGEPIKPGVLALDYYASFARDGSSAKTWDPDRDNTSIEAFAKGDVAMMIGYARTASEIKKKNPSLRFGAAKLPQIKGNNEEINYGSYWNFGVTRKTRNPELAWDFLKFLTSKENALIYYKQTKEAPARLDLVDIAKRSNFYGPFAEQVETAVSWRKREFNSYDRIFQDAINATVKYGVEPQIALDTAAKEITNILTEPNLEVRRPAAEGGIKELVVWRSRDSEAMFKKIIDKFEESNKKQVKVTYKQIDDSNYVYEVLNGLAAGKGPDVVSIRNTDLPKYHKILSPVPDGLLVDPKEKTDNAERYRQTFMEAIADDNIIDDKVYGLPMGIDILKLYYNQGLARELIKADARLEEQKISDRGQELLSRGPQTWEELKEIVSTMKDLGREKSAIAVGSGKGVTYSPDILSSIMAQRQTEMTRLDKNIAVFNLPLSGSNKNPGLDALNFYLNYNWNPGDNDLDKFLQNDLLMMFGYNDFEPYLAKKNPDLQMKILPFPQFQGEKEATYARYWSETVTKNSLYQDLAWKFNLLSAGQMRDYYNQLTNFSDPRRPEKPTVTNREDIERTAIQTWHQIDSKKVDEILREMIDDAKSGKKTPEQALNLAAGKINEIMKRVKRLGY